MHEGLPSDALRQAYTYLSEATTVCFLGFGYDSTNVRRLELRKVRNCRLLGSAFGLDANAIGQAHSLLSQEVLRDLSEE